MLYNEKVISDATPSVGVYEGNQGPHIMKEGKKLKDMGQKLVDTAQKGKKKAYGINLTKGMNELSSNEQLMSNPEALNAEMDKLAKSVASEIDDEGMKLDILADFEITKSTYLNKATTNMKRVQAERNRSLTYDSIYDGIDSIGTSFGNAVSGDFNGDDIVNYQYQTKKIRQNIHALNPDGTYMFSDAQRRQMSEAADKQMMSSFIDTYSKLSEGQRLAIASKLENNYFKIPVFDDGFKYKGNIDLNARPVYRNADGSVSTEVTKTFEFDGKHVILPTIRTEDGKRIDMTDKEAAEWFVQTGEHFGAYNTEAEANKAAEAIHNRGEKGVDLRDIVGEDVYEDIKRNINNINSLMAKEQMKARKAERDLRVANFSLNPSGVEFKALKKDYPDLSQKTLDALEKTWKESPNFQAETKNWQQAQNAIMAFVDKEFGENDDVDRMESYLGAVADIRRANINGIIGYDKMVEKLSELKRVMLDKEALDVYRAVKPYYNSALSTLAKIEEAVYGEEKFFNKYQEKRMNKKAHEFLGVAMDNAFLQLQDTSNPDAAENFRIAMKKAREAVVGYVDPNLANLTEGQIFSVNGVPHKYLGVSNNGDVLTEKVK